jgi:midasin (ATPase involved in ribosome maturation)
MSNQDKQQLSNLFDNLINFFSEFQFEVSFRFLNTWLHHLKNQKGKSYIINYLTLIDSPYTVEIQEKMKSQEFKQLLEVLKNVPVEKIINTRFDLYYGAQGTGKTTLALKETNGKCIVCHSAMLPADLIEDFTFTDGKAAFQPSELCKAMMEGYPIVLDELNLLPFDSIRFLQGLLDGKESFVYKGHTINIKDGFKIIGTMNLRVNGSVYGLPEPLVDRAFNIREFKLTGQDLLLAL